MDKIANVRHQINQKLAEILNRNPGMNTSHECLVNDFNVFETPPIASPQPSPGGEGAEPDKKRVLTILDTF